MKRLSRAKPRLTQANFKQLQTYHWPGNIRELQNVIERAIIINRDGRLSFDLSKTDKGQEIDLTSSSFAVDFNASQALPYNEEVRLQRDRDNILATLANTNWKVSGKGGAAELLGTKATTLASRMNVLSIEKTK